MEICVQFKVNVRKITIMINFSCILVIHLYDCRQIWIQVCASDRIRCIDMLNIAVDDH